MSKTCTRCKRELDLSEFNWKIKNIRLSAHCKGCSRQYIKSHYDRNRQYYIAKAHTRNLRTKAEINKYVWTYLRTHPCVDCGETNAIVLEFDHRESEIKVGEISGMLKDRGVLETIIKEIAKCDVRCANCHRRKTANEIKSWKTSYKRLLPNG